MSKNRKTVYVNDQNAEFVEEVDNFSGLVNDLLDEHRQSIEYGAEEQIREQLEELEDELEDEREILEEKQKERERLQNKLENLQEEKEERKQEVVEMVEQLYSNTVKPQRWTQRFRDVAIVGDPDDLFEFIVDETDLLYDKGSEIVLQNVEPEDDFEAIQKWVEEQQGDD